MKSRVLITFGLASVVVLFGSFMVREKEEAMKPSVDYYLLQDRGFTSFISNLQKMEALVYIPKSKLINVRSMGISLLSRDKAAVINKQIAASTDDFVQLYPSGDSGEEVSLNFEKLDMISYVRQEKATTKAVDMFLIKLDPGSVFHKVESVTIDAARPEELQIKWDGNKVSQAYVPVIITDVKTIR